MYKVYFMDKNSRGQSNDRFDLYDDDDDDEVVAAAAVTEVALLDEKCKE